MMIYVNLFLTFAKIALFNFGGGYAMISLIQDEISRNNWLSQSQFADIIAVSEMTPGAIAINTATFVGYEVAGLGGAIAATLAIPIPSLILAVIISKYILRFKKHPLSKWIFYSIRPVIVGLIIFASFIIAETSLVNIHAFDNILKNPFEFINVGSVIILILTMVALLRFKLNPILIIIGSGIAGMVIFTFI